VKESGATETLLQPVAYASGLRRREAKRAGFKLGATRFIHTFTGLRLCAAQARTSQLDSAIRTLTIFARFAYRLGRAGGLSNLVAHASLA